MIQMSASETETEIPGKVGYCASRVDFFIQNLKVTFKIRELCWNLPLSLLSLFIIHAIFSSAGAPKKYERSIASIHPPAYNALKAHYVSVLKNCNHIAIYIGTYTTV